MKRLRITPADPYDDELMGVHVYGRCACVTVEDHIDGRCAQLRRNLRVMFDNAKKDASTKKVDDEWSYQ